MDPNVIKYDWLKRNRSSFAIRHERCRAFGDIFLPFYSSRTLNANSRIPSTSGTKKRIGVRARVMQLYVDCRGLRNDVVRANANAVDASSCVLIALPIVMQWFESCARMGL